MLCSDWLALNNMFLNLRQCAAIVLKHRLGSSVEGALLCCAEWLRDIHNQTVLSEDERLYFEATCKVLLFLVLEYLKLMQLHSIPDSGGQVAAEVMVPYLARAFAALWGSGGAALVDVRKASAILRQLYEKEDVDHSPHDKVGTPHSLYYCFIVVIERDMR